MWGFTQAESHALGLLHDVLRSLALFPGMGRDAGSLKAGCPHFEHGVHVVFYRETKTGVFVIRVLHQQMLPENYI